MGVFPHTHIKPRNITFIVFKKFTFGLKLFLVLFLIVGMSPHTSNYSRLSCFSKINKSFFHSFYCFCIPRKNSQGPQSPRRGPELQALAMLGFLGPTIRAKSDCGCARSLNSFWPPIHSSQRPKKCFSVDAKNLKRGLKWLGLFLSSLHTK